MRRRLLRAASAALLTSVFLTLAAIAVGFLLPSSPPVVVPVNAATLNIPYTFSSGTPIYASQMNGNFTAVRNVVNALDDANISNASLTGSTKLIDATVTLGKLAADSVNSSKIVDASVALADMATDSVNSSKVVDGSVAEADLDINNAASDGLPLTWNASAGKMAWGGGLKCTGMLGQSLLAGDNHNFFQSFNRVDLTAGSGYARESSTESDVDEFIVPSNVTFHSLYVLRGTVPGSGNTVTFTLRDDGADTALTCTVSASVTCNSGSASVAVAQGSRINMKTTIVNTPTASATGVSLCFTPY